MLSPVPDADARSGAAYFAAFSAVAAVPLIPFLVLTWSLARQGVSVAHDVYFTAPAVMFALAPLFALPQALIFIAPLACPAVRQRINLASSVAWGSVVAAGLALLWASTLGHAGLRFPEDAAPFAAYGAIGGLSFWLVLITYARVGDLARTRSWLRWLLWLAPCALLVAVLLAAVSVARGPFAAFL
jgi:hypothetical protein